MSMAIGFLSDLATAGLILSFGAHSIRGSSMAKLFMDFEMDLSILGVPAGPRSSFTQPSCMPVP
jgi:hypothetical protein